MFLIFYGVVRFLVEFARQPDEQLGFIAFGWLTMGQLLSLALSLAGALFSLGISVSRSRRSGSHFTSASQR
jgi:phosphatidylglycerol:prolipoprotein diacylglycerol transferase